MDKVTITLNPRKFAKIAGIAAGILVLPASAYFGMSSYCNRLLDDAEAFLKKGLPTLAVEVLEPHRGRMARTERGCRVLITSYMEAFQDAGMQWAAETCVNAGFDVFEAYMAGAKVQMAHGNEMGALQLLKGAQRFRRPESALAMMQLFRHLKRHEDLLGMALVAPAEYPGNPDLNLESLRVLVEYGKWDQAKRPALMLKDFFSRTPADPETRKLVATVFEKLNDPASARFVMESNAHPPATVLSPALQPGPSPASSGGSRQ